MAQNRVFQDQFGYWLSAGFRKSVGLSSRGFSERKEMEVQLIKSVDAQCGGELAAETDKLRKLENLKAGKAGELSVCAEK